MITLRNKKCLSTPDGIRNHNLPIRSRAPYPLGHGGSSQQPESNQRPTDTLQISKNKLLQSVALPTELC